MDVLSLLKQAEVANKKLCRKLNYKVNPLSKEKQDFPLGIIDNAPHHPARYERYRLRRD